MRDSSQHDPCRIVEPERLMRGGKDDAAGRAVAGHRFREPAERGLVEAVAGFVEQPDRRAAGHEPRERRALALAGGEQADRHLREVGEPHCVEAAQHIVRTAAVEPRPETERISERRIRIERSLFRRERNAAEMLDLAGRRLEQPRGQPQQARFTRAVRAGYQPRLAGAEREAEPFEQQPAAAQARDAVKGEARAQASRSSACMSSSESPK